MKANFVFIDLKTMETSVSSDLSALARHTGASLSALYNGLRHSRVLIKKDYIVSRVSSRVPSARAKGNLYGKGTFRWTREPIPQQGE